MATVRTSVIATMVVVMSPFFVMTVMSIVMFPVLFVMLPLFLMIITIMVIVMSVSDYRSVMMSAVIVMMVVVTEVKTNTNSDIGCFGWVSR